MEDRLVNLEELEVASPCNESWDAMQGDDRARLCTKCNHCVFNLSDMTREEAEDFILSRKPGDRTCIRLYRRFDGTVMTRDCPDAARKRWTTRAIWAGATAATVTLVGAAAAAATTTARSSGAGHTGIYAKARNVVLDRCDWVGHKFGISSLCNCPPMVMGLMVCPTPPTPTPPATTPGTGTTPGPETETVPEPPAQ
jgi:hypothetical protein